MEEFNITKTIVWQDAGATNNLLLNLGVTDYNGHLPFFLSGDEVAKLYRGGISLEPRHLLYGILIGLDDLENRKSTQFWAYDTDRNELISILSALQKYFEKESLEVMIMEVADVLGKQYGSSVKNTVLKAGLNILPNASLIKAEMIINTKILVSKDNDESWMQRLWDWADDNSISSEDLPRDAYKLLTLEYLDLEEEGDDGYVLNEIPKEIGMLSNLTRLTLSVDGDCKALPEEIGMLSNLEEFIVSNCGLHELNMPKSIINLTHVDVVSFSGNIPTSSIELVLHNCESLSRLYIDNNHTLKILPKNICHCSSLKELVLVNNRNLLLAPKQFKWAINLRDDEEGWEKEYSFILRDGTLGSYTTDYGQKFRYYSITPWDRLEKMPKPNFSSEEELLEVDCI